MSYIPNHAMPHTYVHDEDGSAPSGSLGSASATPARALKIAGGALVGLLLFKLLR
jgi:hypothetical protein